MTNAIDAGIIWTNTVNYLSNATPLSGHKESGFGEDLGIEAIRAYTRLKTAVINYGGQKLEWA